MKKFTISAERIKRLSPAKFNRYSTEHQKIILKKARSMYNRRVNYTNKKYNLNIPKQEKLNLNDYNTTTFIKQQQTLIKSPTAKYIKNIRNEFKQLFSEEGTLDIYDTITTSNMFDLRDVELSPSEEDQLQEMIDSVVDKEATYSDLISLVNKIKNKHKSAQDLWDDVSDMFNSDSFFM